MSGLASGRQIIQITDTFDSDAVNKIIGAYVKHTAAHDLPAAHISVDAASNATVIGTKVSELFTNKERPPHLVVAVNYAPPDPDKKNGHSNNHRRGFFAARLQGDDVVCGTSNGLEFSYIKPLIREFYQVTASNNGSQFRSLEILPGNTVAAAAQAFFKTGLDKIAFKRIDRIDDVIPSVPDRTHVLQVDNFGNVKLVLSNADREFLESRKGKPVWLSFGNAAIEAGGDLKGQRFGGNFVALASDKLFDPGLGTNVIAINSSSSLVGGASVPIIATMRDKPADTRPNYKTPVVGAPVLLSADRPTPQWIQNIGRRLHEGAGLAA